MTGTAAAEDLDIAVICNQMRVIDAAFESLAMGNVVTLGGI